MYPHSWPRSRCFLDVRSRVQFWGHSWMTFAPYPEEQPYPQGLRLEHLSFLTQKTMWKTLFVFFGDMIDKLWYFFTSTLLCPHLC